jgi:dihydrolipoamide dehydrogenase
MSEQKSLTVLGGGPGGYASALYSAQLGMKVTLVEKRNIGGTCLNEGCIPTKVFVQAAELFHKSKKFSDFGLILKEDPEIDFEKIMNNKIMTVNQLKGGVQYLLTKAGVNIINGEGKLLSQNEVEVNDGTSVTSISSDYIIIATGSQEINIPGFKADGDKILNSSQMLDIKELPESIAIIGGGVIGVEFASILGRFGKKVTIVELTDRLLPSEEQDVSELLEYKLKEIGIDIYTKTKATSIITESENGIIFEIENEEGKKNIEVEKMLVCVGRKACTDNIGLDAAGINKVKNAIKTNEYMQTNIPNVYAVGDVTDSIQLAHIAYHEAKVAVKNIAGIESKIDYSAVPLCVFSYPEVARVGLTYDKASELYTNVSFKKVPFSGNGKAMIEQNIEGFTKIVIDDYTKKILGFSIIGPKASELIAEPTLAVSEEISLESLSDCINAHPSLSEMIAETIASAEGLKLHVV